MATRTRRTYTRSDQPYGSSISRHDSRFKLNLGITDVEIREDGVQQQIVISTSRQTTKLANSNCYLQLSASGWEAKHLVDVVRFGTANCR